MAQLTKEPSQELHLRDIVTNASWPDVRLTLSTETPDERASRLRREEAQHSSSLKREEDDASFKRTQEAAETTSRRGREGVAFYAALGFMLAFFGACLWIILSKTFPTETEKWATTALASILGAVLGAFSGYSYGKGAGK
jgi:hypothetical protein